MSDTAERRNWADNYTYQAHEITEPTSIADIQQVAEKSQHTSAVGSRHSFNAIADTEGTLVSLHTFNRVLDLDTEAMTVTVEAGMTYGQLASFLSEKEYALHNLASLPHISVVGACMTGTHGSGETNGNLATAVCGLEFITADGQVVRRTQDEHPDEFAGLVVGLGAYGIVTAITLRILPQYQMRQNVYLDLPFSEALAQFDEIQASGYSVSLFTRWQASHFEQLWVKQIVDETTSNQAPPELFGAVAARDNVHPLIDLSAESCTEQLGIVGDWQDRLPHFRMDHTPSHGDELQSEYFVPREHAAEALTAIQDIRTAFNHLLYISEIRTVAADDLWMSPCYGRDSVGIHFTWKPQQAEVMGVLPHIEDALKPFGVRPHWGKLFTLSGATISEPYERLNDFCDLVRRYDPSGKFTNSFLNKMIFGQ